MTKSNALKTLTVCVALLGAMASPLRAQTPPTGEPSEADRGAQASDERRATRPDDPVEAVMKSGDATTTLGRARLRDNLYALLATAESDERAKQIAARIEQLWRTPGSDTVRLLIQRASAAVEKTQTDRALKLLDAATEIAPDYAEVWHQRAVVHYQLGDLRAAAGDLRRVLALDQNHFKALHGLAAIMEQTGQDRAALDAYERLLEVHPFWEGAEKSVEELREKIRGRGI
ncbi:MAG: tetratricopeptide repeat protein [Hyphomicrobiaceae bacterium]